jgi:hypothetical protein
VLIGGLAMPAVVKVLTFYAAVKSFRSIQTPDPEDDKQWCDSLPPSPTINNIISLSP